jgi:uncharacterized membrane protein YdjX (TVP38/TMEM64 family)
VSREQRINRRLLALGVGVGLCLTAALVATSQGWLGAHTLSALAADHGTGTARTAALYLGFVVVAELLWMPRSWGLVASGLLFGPWLGIALSATADLTTAAFAYAVARRAGSEGTRAWLARRPRAAALVESPGAGLSRVLLRVLPVLD